MPSKYPGNSARIAMLLISAAITFRPITAETGAADAAKTGSELSPDANAVMDRAEAQSEALRGRLAMLRAIEARSDQAGLWPNPSADLTFGQISSGGSSGPSVELRIFQPFTSAGKLDKRKAVLLALQGRAKVEVEEFRLVVRYEALRLAYAYSAAVDLTDHLTERVTRLRLMSAYLQSRPFASPQRFAQKTVVERKLDRIEKSLREAELTKENLWFELNVFLNYSERLPVRIRWFNRGPELRLDDVAARALEHNADLRRKRQAVMELQSELALAQAEAWPDFGLSAIYRRERGAGSERYYGAGITLPLPVWNRNQHGIRAAELGLEAALDELKFETRRVENLAVARHASFETARKNLGAFPLSRMRELDISMNHIEAEFRKGRIDFLTFIEAENETFDGHLNVFAAQLEFAQRYIDLLITTFSRDFRVE